VAAAPAVVTATLTSLPSAEQDSFSAAVALQNVTPSQDPFVTLQVLAGARDAALGTGIPNGSVLSTASLLSSITGQRSRVLQSGQALTLGSVVGL